MFLKPFEISTKLSVSEIVAKDYRTADVFRRYGIGYCCGGKWPLDIACQMQGVDELVLQKDLKNAIRTINISSQIDFASWDTDFLIDYIVNIHHQYLKNSLPETKKILDDFSKEHVKKYSYIGDLEKQFDLLFKQLISSMKWEEEVLFPYIRQVAHAHKGKQQYAVLLVKTLRKPVEETMFKSHETVSDLILSIRKITNQYTTPENVCTSHKVVIAKLKELDNDIMQHLHLEQSILFPRAIAIEKEVQAM